MDVTFERAITSYIPLPVCVVNSKGKIVNANEHISDVFIYDSIEDADFFALTGIKFCELHTAVEGQGYLTLERNGKRFHLLVSRESEGENERILVFFDDITNFDSLRTLYNEEKICVCMINIDNFEELVSSTSPEMRMVMSTEVDRAIRQWAARVSGSINRLNDSQYIMYFQNGFVEEMIADKFSLLDEVRQIETEADFPMSLSMGIGIGGKTPALTEEYASAALDLALGRGGDQVVIKRMSKIEYYGGVMQTVEKSNKGKSRVVAHALKQLIEQVDRVVIMGHRNPDMDVFGAALGIFRICVTCGTDAYILINEINDSLQAIYKKAKETQEYEFINSKKAETIVDKDTLIVMVDTHRPSYAENAQILHMTDKIAVIDHHRRAEDSVANSTLSYIESYASSTSELVSEILQYAGSKKTLGKLEAEALLGGITIDTNRFAVKTGVRTFEAAAWLRRAGADTTKVKRFFQTDMNKFKIRAKCIAAADFYRDDIATSICEGLNEDAQIINSQVADELLNIKGIKASFVAGKTEKGSTVISARSLGDINVQVIMEKLGGGGHLTTAGAQVEVSPEEAIQQALELVKIRQEEKI